MDGRQALVAVRMFGPLSITVVGRDLGYRDLGGIKPRQLLEILLLARGQAVSKDRIADDLWRDRLPRSASRTIETYVSLLRRTVHRSVISTETGGYRVRSDVVTTDLDRFEELLRLAVTTTGADRRAALRAALDVSTAELLADEPYADWVLGPREHCRAQRLRVQLELAELELETGEPDAAVAAAEDVLAAEPMNERATRAAMSAHARRDDPAAALRVYARCRAALAADLGVQPSSRTAALHRSILSGEPGVEIAVPPVRYAVSDDVRIAYQLVGRGPVDLVFLPSFVTNLGATWDDPTYAGFLHGLAATARLILFDKRGTGLSDPVVTAPTATQRTADLLSVLDAAGVARAVLFGVCGGGSQCIRFAAEHPDRTAGLVLFGAAARIISCDDYPWGWSAQAHERFLAAFEQAWLTGGRPERRNPGLVGDPRYRDWFARYVRLAASPFTARQLAEANAHADVRDLLPAVRAPCLVLVRTDDVWLDAQNSRYLAAHIPGAQLVEFPGLDHDPWVGDSRAVLAVLRAFLPRTVQRDAVARKT